MKCGRGLSDQRKSCVVGCGEMRPAEETGNIGSEVFIPWCRMSHFEHAFWRPGTLGASGKQTEPSCSA